MLLFFDWLMCFVLPGHRTLKMWDEYAQRIQTDSEGYSFLFLFSCCVGTTSSQTHMKGCFDVEVKRVCITEVAYRFLVHDQYSSLSCCSFSCFCWPCGPNLFVVKQTDAFLSQWGGCFNFYLPCSLIERWSAFLMFLFL